MQLAIGCNEKYFFLGCKINVEIENKFLTTTQRKKFYLREIGMGFFEFLTKCSFKKKNQLIIVKFFLNFFGSS